MIKKFKLFAAFHTVDYVLWGFSVGLVLIFFFLFDGKGYLTLAASLVGVTSLIFSAKGNPVGQALMVVFSILYGILSYTSAYWGEMITYLGMTMPMAVAALAAWLRHPYEGRRQTVAVGRLSPRGYVLMAVLTAAVTVVFYVILRALGTPCLGWSTLSVTTSFAAVYLTARRSPFFAIAYAANDLVLIVLWVIAARADRGYVSVVVCFAVFFLNDLYGYVNWRRMERAQRGGRH